MALYYTHKQPPLVISCYFLFLQVERINYEHKVLYVAGNVPGHADGMVRVKDSVYKPFKEPPPFPTNFDTDILPLEAFSSSIHCPHTDSIKFQGIRKKTKKWICHLFVCFCWLCIIITRIVINVLVTSFICISLLLKQWFAKAVLVELHVGQKNMYLYIKIHIIRIIYYVVPLKIIKTWKNNSS